MAKSRDIEFRRNGEELTVEQLEEAFGLLSADMPLREVPVLIHFLASSGKLYLKLKQRLSHEQVHFSDS